MRSGEGEGGPEVGRKSGELKGIGRGERVIPMAEVEWRGKWERWVVSWVGYLSV